MEPSDIKLDLHNKIDHADDVQLKELYGLVNNYLNSNTDDDWSNLSGRQQEALTKGLADADAGLGNPLSKVNERLRDKYRLNG